MNPTEQIKDRLSILDVVSTYVRVEKSGNQYKARCPFHNEKTPSFYISPGRNTYHCFGCSKGGDIFSFIQEIEHVPFKEALTLLADRAGVELKNFRKSSDDASLFDVLESAVLFFKKTITLHPDVLLYTQDRGIFPETTEMFSVGYAPNEWRKLYENLNSLGYSDEAIERSGLCVKTEKGYYDRFRGRLMFPIYNPSAKAVGFTGRILPNIEKLLDKPTAKYVNTPETELYHKSKILFGYHLAKKKIVDEDLCIVVEGQMDVVMCHQAGTQNTVAVSGTAFTSEQISLIKRLTKKIAFCFDSDSAGLSALKRSAQLALLSDMDVYVINIPSAKDPAELIQENADIWHETIKNKQHIISYLLEKSHIEITDERARIARVTKDVMPLLASMQDKIDQSFFIKETSSDLRVPYESVESSMKTLGNHDLYQAENYQKDESESKSENIFDKRFEKVMEELVGLLYLVDNDSRNKYSSEIDIILRESNFGIKSLSDIPEEVINKYSIHAEKLYTDDKKRLLEIEKIKLNLEELSLETQLNAFNTLGNLEQGSADKTLKDKLLIAKRLDIIRKKRHTHQ